MYINYQIKLLKALESGLCKVLPFKLGENFKLEIN